MFSLSRSVCLVACAAGVLVVAGDAAAGRGKALRSRLDLAPEARAVDHGRGAPRGTVRVRTVRGESRLSCRVRGLEAEADYGLVCDALGEEPLAFQANRRGRARLKGLTLSATAPGSVLSVEVVSAEGGAVLRGELDHHRADRPSHPDHGDPDLHHTDPAQPDPDRHHSDAGHDHADHSDTGHGGDSGPPSDDPHHGDPGTGHNVHHLGR
jgi:hypothetical protein